MAVLAAMMGVNPVNADDMAATLLAREIARAAGHAMAVVRNGNDYVVVAYARHRETAGELFMVIYPADTRAAAT